MKLNSGIKNELKLSSEYSLFFYVNNKVMKQDMLFKDVLEKNRSEDGFLYVKIRTMEDKGCNTLQN